MPRTLFPLSLNRRQLDALARELTEREALILVSFAQGISIDDIAEAIHIPRVLAEVELDIAKRIARAVCGVAEELSTRRGPEIIEHTRWQPANSPRFLA